MFRQDALEAAPLVQRLCVNLASTISSKGVDGANARTALGDLEANALILLRSDMIGQPLDNCFDLVRQTGVLFETLDWVRSTLMLETPVTLGANLTRDYSEQLCLAHEALIVSEMVFTSREDVETVISEIQGPFADSEEIAADTMDAMVYRSIVELHAAIINHLVVTERPLPEMLVYQFYEPLPTLIIAQRLYGEASRYDQIRDENKIVHPAFCPTIGRALSF
jgi:prophage DNA circulation protein